ncbi:hypothetical protein N7X13_004352 [Salmonella enterica]|nr:hypothetical protein [Salmonella enterica]EEC4048976.1 hypothetical protein [Salmonella enterica]EFT2498086.1 hypothetical protein [Salmonella enterica]EJV8112402.1 hypothetical protein [Salmonella enterica]EJZ3940217.1 hypothetical protein [Salmonella enterica]
MSKVIDFPTGKKREHRVNIIRARREKNSERNKDISTPQFWWVKKIKLLTVIKRSVIFLSVHVGLLFTDILIYLLIILGKLLKSFLMFGIIAALLLLVVEYSNDWHYMQSSPHTTAIFIGLIALRIAYSKLLNGLIRLKIHLYRRG